MQNRGAIYAFIKSVFTTAPTEELLKRLRQPEVLENLKQIGISLSPEDLDQSSLKELDEDYVRLFIGPQKHIALNESIYREETPQFWGEAAVENNRLLHELGLSLKDDWNLMPDHITVELEILQKLVKRENEALAEDDDAIVQKCQSYSREFFLNHIAKWVPEVCDKIVQQATTQFYKQMGLFVKNFIQFEEKRLSQ